MLAIIATMLILSPTVSLLEDNLCGDSIECIQPLLDDISLFTLNLSIRGGTNDRVAGGAGSQP